jgi:hypothetical protein
LEKHGIAEIAKEVDGNGTEQVLIRLIHKERDKKEANSKEVRRELERKREEKEMERTMREMQRRHAADSK